MCNRYGGLQVADFEEGKGTARRCLQPSDQTAMNHGGY
jgi:hypothetical protein